MNRLRLFQEYCSNKGWKYIAEKRMGMYRLEITFPSSETITAESMDLEKALDIIKEKLQEKLNNKGRK